MDAPKLFISYAWSNADHEQWVIDFATDLVNSGVDVLLDKWELREGHDPITFMEKMVTDPLVQKVVMICDQKYAAKADGREGGVGTETQIISAKVYASQSQDKFVAVIAERDDAGKPYLPTYYASRMYVDFSDADRYADSLEKLLRWVFDKPLLVKPSLGTPPSYVVEENPVTLGTSALAKRVLDGLKGDKSYARGAVDEYLAYFCQNLERFRISKVAEHLDDEVLHSIEAFTPSRTEFITVLSTLIQYANADTYKHRLHRFFEDLIPYLFRPTHAVSWNEDQADNFKFLIHELFLYTIATLLRTERFTVATHLLSEPYYLVNSTSQGGHTILGFTLFRTYVRSIEVRNKRLGLRRLSLRAEILEQRSRASGIQFRYLLQADFVCFLRAHLAPFGKRDTWWPETLIYASNQYAPCELFARSASKAYLERVLHLLGAADFAAFKNILEFLRNNQKDLPRWEFESFEPDSLVGIEALGSRA